MHRFLVPTVHQGRRPYHSSIAQTSGKKVKWEWTDEHQTAFDRLKESLTTAPVLVCPDWNKPFTLQTDASQEGLGAALSQPEDQGEQIVAYASRSLTKAERNYSTTELECLAVKWGIWKMRDYLEGYHFTILTDHLSPEWLGQMDNPSGRIARWAMKLSQWDYTIKYQKGSDNLLADTLSRQPLPTCVVTSQNYWYHRRKRMVEEDAKAHPEYTVKNGRLYRLILHTLDFNEADPSSQWKICVPRAEQGRVLKEEHDEPVAGHLGIAKTLARLARKYY